MTVGYCHKADMYHGVGRYRKASCLLAETSNRWFFCASHLAFMLESNCIAASNVDSWSLWNRLLGSKM